MIIEMIAKTLNINSVFTGFSLATKKPIICMKIHIENNFKECMSLPLNSIKKRTIKKAT